MFTSSKTGSTFNAGFFLADDEDCLRETAVISKDHTQKVTRGKSVIVPMGAVIPANDGTAVGILYEDIDVTEDDHLGSIVTRGAIYGERLPEALSNAAAAALTGIDVRTEPTVERPTAFARFVTLKVTSAEGGTSGKTTITVAGYTLKTGEAFVYSTHATEAPEAKLGTDVSAWTALSGDVTATTGHKITVAVKDSSGKAIASGTATVTAKA